MRHKEGIKPVDPFDESIRRELCSEKLTVLVSTIVIVLCLTQCFDALSMQWEGFLAVKFLFQQLSKVSFLWRQFNLE